MSNILDNHALLVNQVMARHRQSSVSTHEVADMLARLTGAAQSGSCGFITVSATRRHATGRRSYIVEVADPDTMAMRITASSTGAYIITGMGTVRRWLSMLCDTGNIKSIKLNQ
ncbi:MAG: hypothetical protein ACI3YB_01950 [Prevotella sp.]